jgi:cell wall assembly regulator SMI1
MDINEVIKELFLFSDRVLSLNEPVNGNDVDVFEKKYNLKLPSDYQELLKSTNGFDLMGATVYGIFSAPNFSLEQLYIREHSEVANPLFDYLVPFSPDGGGSHYCFDTRTIKDNSCDIVFWQYDYPYTETDPPEITNPSFAEWVKEVVIDWTLEDHNYDGSEK